MDTRGVQWSGQFGTLAGTGLIEVILGVAITVLAVILIVLVVRRSSANRKRKAAGSAYFDHDAAHYGPLGRSDQTATPGSSTQTRAEVAPRFSASQPTAPTFNAPQRSGRGRSKNAPDSPAAVSPSSERVKAPTVTESSAPSPKAVNSSAVAPIPSLKPKGELPPTLPAMPAPPSAPHG